MFFKNRSMAPRKEEKVKNQMTIADILAFRDTWTDSPEEGFSVERIICRARREKQRKAQVPKLVMSENGFKVRDKESMDESELEIRRVQSTLNKLTESNFDAVSKEMLSPLLIFNPVVLNGAVNIIFTKAVAEPVFSALYAHLCATIAKYESTLIAEAQQQPESDVAKTLKEYNERMANETKENAVQAVAGGKGSLPPDAAANARPGNLVRVALVLRCQVFYNSFVNHPKPENEEMEETLRKQNMANIKFVGELFMRSLVTDVVVVFVCSTALSLNIIAESAPTPITDANVEMVINLLNVVGKRFDEKSKKAVSDTIWNALNACTTNKQLSMRIRFLLQNLLERRNAGWPVKDSAPLASSSANTDEANHQNAHDAGNGHNKDAQHHAGGGGYNHHHGGYHQYRNNNANGSSPNNNNGGGGYQPRRMQRSVSLNQQDAYAHPPLSRRQDRITSYNDLGQFSGYNSAPLNNYHQAPPPPPPFPQDAEISEEDKKLIALARPPKALNPSLEVRMLCDLRDAMTDGDWKTAESSILKTIPDEAEHVCRMCAAYAAIKNIAQCKLEEDRALFTEVLKNDIFNANALSRGFSWFLTEAITTGLKEDYPRVFTRFIDAVVKNPHIDFICMVRDIAARTASYLDALFISLQGDVEEWEQEYLDVWVHLLKAWKKHRANDSVNTKKILSSLGGVKQRPFTCAINADFIMELYQEKFIDTASIKKWVAENGEMEKFKPFVEELRLLFTIE